MSSLSKKQQPGFSVVEVIVAITMAGIIVGSINSLLASTHRLDRAGEMKEKASALAKQSLEIISDIQDEAFACRCDDIDDDCNTIPGSCRKDGQPACLLLEGFQSCWTEFPDGLDLNSPLHLEETGGWHLAEGLETVATDPEFTREISIENLARDADGHLDATGTGQDSGAKKVMVTVSWQERQNDRQISLSTILTAWKEL